MSNEAAIPDQLTEVTNLTAALADMVLDAQIMGRPVTEVQTRALAKAARLLREHGVAWPPLLEQALHGLAEAIGELAPDAPTSDALPSVDDHGLSRFFAMFRREKGEP